MEYTNRYGDVYTFTKQEDGNVLWEGKFEYMRAGDDSMIWDNADRCGVEIIEVPTDKLETNGVK